MPMFFTPKPRQFHYEPRFYDPEKEKWEALKQKYADEHDVPANNEDNGSVSDDELKYFQDKVRQMNRTEKRQASKFGIRDLFRRREMPKFNYQPRFQNTTENSGVPVADNQLIDKYSHTESKHRVRIRRRYDIEDVDYMKPIPAGKIMLYALLACILLYWILF